MRFGFLLRVEERFPLLVAPLFLGRRLRESGDRCGAPDLLPADLGLTSLAERPLENVALRLLTDDKDLLAPTLATHRPPGVRGPRFRPSLPRWPQPADSPPKTGNVRVTNPGARGGYSGETCTSITYTSGGAGLAHTQQLISQLASMLVWPPVARVYLCLS